MATGPYDNGTAGIVYPLTKMNFLVTVDGIDGTAAFSEVSGIEATVEPIEFRQGNSNSLAVVKVPGLVKHGNVTLKLGYSMNSAFKAWIQECVSEVRGQMPRNNVSIELIDINAGAPTTVPTTVQGQVVWMLTNAWVTKYTAPDLNAIFRALGIPPSIAAAAVLTLPLVATFIPK